jgi:hypothetical protein
MSKRFSAAALLVTALSAPCGGRSSALTPVGSAGSGGNTVDAAAGTDGSIAGSDGGDDLPGDALGADVTAPPRLAANGAPIPAPALAKNSCAFLDVQSFTCSTSSKACEPLSCGCSGLVFDRCVLDKCIVGISCPAACAAAPDPLSRVLDCLFKPLCKSDADCKQTSSPYKCLVPPNAAIGECTTGASGSACLADADCQSGACVVTDQDVGVCGGGFGYVFCNTDEQCSAGATDPGGGAFDRCVIPPGNFVGRCTTATGGSPCFTQRDCQPSVKCGLVGQVPGVGDGSGVCNARRDGAPCSSDVDCDSGFFCGAGGKCSDGTLGTVCQGDGSGCVAGLHCSRDPFNWVCVGPQDAGGQ